MCNETSPRTTQGGLIAILHPPTPSSQPITLHLTNPLPNHNTSIHLQGLGPSQHNDKYSIIIHRDGDLCRARHDPMYTLPVSRLDMEMQMQMRFWVKGLLGGIEKKRRDRNEVVAWE
ncbi:hypothetical protein BDW02DRAFT_76154 [Decorospora gaudefroyi]|uniref:Uncharacterized protein n=1 Tax=Decorospora gaudefroyi TaxID=184978 RepID=A0A6A5K1S8_9PLEO|nr:hypothetical protein BDW02DRAFT_76154 [Decorospora gaudefroyi]